MSASGDDEQPEGKPDESKTDTKTAPAVDSLFDAPSPGLGAKPAAPSFTPPPIPSFTPPQVNKIAAGKDVDPAGKASGTTPRTSDKNTSVSGEFGESDAKPAVDAPKAVDQPDAKPAVDAPKVDDQPDAKPAANVDAKPDDATSETKADVDATSETKADDAKSETKADDSKSKTKAGDSKSETKADDDDKSETKSDDDTKSETKSDDDAKSETKSDDDTKSETEPKTKPKPAAPKPAEPEPASSGSPSILLIIAVAAAIVLAVWYVGSAANRDEGGQGPSKPNADKSGTSTKPPAKPAPRSKVTQHTPDLGSTKQPPEKPVEPPPEPTNDTADIEPVDTGEPTPEPDIEPPPVEPPPVEPPKIAIDNPRDPALIPSGTPVENAKAFSKLPVAPSDGPPIGGIGRSGIHVDDIAMGEGRDNTGCEQPTRSFSTGTEFVNVCFRVIHPRASETLRVYWEKDGTVTRRGKVRIPENLHAYKTRAYLQVRPEYVGKWRVRIVPEGEDAIELAVAEFEISN